MKSCFISFIVREDKLKPYDISFLIIRLTKIQGLDHSSVLSEWRMRHSHVLLKGTTKKHDLYRGEFVNNLSQNLHWYSPSNTHLSWCSSCTRFVENSNLPLGLFDLSSSLSEHYLTFCQKIFKLFHTFTVPSPESGIFPRRSGSSSKKLLWDYTSNNTKIPP